MRRVALALLVLLVAVHAEAGVYRYTYRVKASPTSDARIPQFIVVDTEAELPTADVGDGDLAYSRDTWKLFRRGPTGWEEVAGGGEGGGAPTDAKYITQTADGDLSAEQALGALATGILKNTTTTGVLSIAVAGDFPTLNQSTSGNAATATALAADPADCATSTHFAVGVTAAGVATCEALADADVPNNITVDLATTASSGDSATAFFPSGAVEVARGGTGAAPGADDQVLVADSTSGATWRAVPDCDNAVASKVLYDTTTNTFSCGTDQTGAGGVTTLTSTTLQSDAVIATYTAITGLSFTPAANTNYLIDCFIRYTSTAATTGINFAWDVPAAVNSIHMTGFTTTVATGANEGFTQRADNVGTATSAAVITVENVAVLNAQLRNGANATPTSLGFTPETANSVSVIAGSVCQVRSY